MPKAIRIHEYGGPEVLRWEEVEVGAPGPGQLRVRHAAVGLNYIDVYHRTGLYPLPSLPWTLGMEGAGQVEAVGEGVTEFKVGDRVAYASPPVGAYAPAGRCLCRSPAGSRRPGGGFARHHRRSNRRCHDVARDDRAIPATAHLSEPGDAILLHAAAGGVGLIASQWARDLGATVIGTVGSDDKAELARAHGCHHVIVYSRENFAERVREITGGQGVAVVYDSVGQATFMGSLDCLRPLGTMVSFGNASGPVPPFEPGATVRAGNFSGQGLAVPDPTDPDDLHRQACGLGGQRCRTVRSGRQRRGQDRSPANLSAGRDRPGAPRSGSAPDDGFHRVVALRSNRAVGAK